MEEWDNRDYYNMSDDGLQAQLAVGAVDPRMILRGNLIVSRTDPKTLSAIVKLWAKTGMTRVMTIYIANILMNHPHLTKKDREYVVKLRNSFIEMHDRLEELVNSHKRRAYIDKIEGLI